MLLAIDVGNTNIVLGVYDGERLVVDWRLATLPDRTADELWVLVNRLLAGEGIGVDQIDGAILSSVVPPLTRAVEEMVATGLGHQPLCVDETNAGLPVLYHDPAEVGADRLVNAVAARALYRSPPRPVIVVDFGTATTFDLISVAGEYFGGVICPGVEISADALYQRAARLPRVEVRKPDALIGRTTAASMQSGLFFGYVAMVEGIVERIRTTPEGTDAVCVATGGLARAVTDETDVIDRVEPHLTLTGLRLVWERNHGAGSVLP